MLVNLPFVIAGYEGWRASFTFQELRKVDITTNSVWYWGFRPWSEPDEPGVPGDGRPALDRARAGVVHGRVGGGLAAVAAWSSSYYPWIGVSAAMLCGFLLLHKVHSPQYTLWLLPFFVLLRVHWGWIVAYLVADLAMYVGIFRLFYLLNAGLDAGIGGGFAAQAVVIGVWGRAVLLAGLFVVALRGADRTRRGSARSRYRGADELSAGRRASACLTRRRRGRPLRGRPYPTRVHPSGDRRTGSVAGRRTLRTTSTISTTTSASRATTAPRNQSGCNPRPPGPT